MWMFSVEKILVKLFWFELFTNEENKILPYVLSPFVILIPYLIISIIPHYIAFLDESNPLNIFYPSYFFYNLNWFFVSLSTLAVVMLLKYYLISALKKLEDFKLIDSNIIRQAYRKKRFLILLVILEIMFIVWWYFYGLSIYDIPGLFIIIIIIPTGARFFSFFTEILSLFQLMKKEIVITPGSELNYDVFHILEKISNLFLISYFGIIGIMWITYGTIFTNPVTGGFLIIFGFLLAIRLHITSYKISHIQEKKKLLWSVFVVSATAIASIAPFALGSSISEIISYDNHSIIKTIYDIIFHVDYKEIGLI